MTIALSPAVERRAKARRGLLLFLSLVVFFNLVFTTVAVRTDNTAWFVALMWSVAFSSVVCRLVLREGFQDVSFRFGGWRTLKIMLLGMAYPLVVALVAYGFAWATGLADYHSPHRGFLVGLILAVTVSPVVGCIATTGEEIGWRGYMLTRLIDAGVPRPVLVSGIIWTAWHMPLIVTGVYEINHGGSVVLGMVGFAMAVISAGFVIARVRLESGSVWPAVLVHSAWNSIFQSAFDPATSGAGAGRWLGEGGLLVGLVAAIAAVLYCRGARTRLQAPGVPMADAGRVTEAA
ncbi:type II CAAX prenyl endopeptidase Rce1 family protein [Streptomyces sp. WI04-05B]|uniref:CPBP family intramembrane glutamic endopeptidase n=1 Tax=Streptomyces TaxID=1883 RepID=UPI0029A2C3C5|nr:MULTISPECIES: CPBP family intramembrane glutamic endopeptidase [unclassified Streptomyces]MDX2547752.1 CPBP family intramembrane metalloprotease [Streptomyces sp. WI04-05B]MDX2590065.1 CPBP family intramembrane metalloprotease [Streptomyces sp. WI04-05A]